MCFPKNYDDFLASIKNEKPPDDWPEGLKALWHDNKGSWEASHDIAQEMHNDLGSWIHAYLHRKEGDEFNAGYWYRKANKPYPRISLDAEHQAIFDLVLKTNPY